MLMNYVTATLAGTFLRSIGIEETHLVVSQKSGVRFPYAPLWPPLRGRPLQVSCWNCPLKQNQLWGESWRHTGPASRFSRVQYPSTPLLVPYSNAERNGLDPLKCGFKSLRDYLTLTPLSVTAARQAYTLHSTRLVRSVGSNPAAATLTFGGLIHGK